MADMTIFFWLLTLLFVNSSFIYAGDINREYSDNLSRLEQSLVQSQSQLPIVSYDRIVGLPGGYEQLRGWSAEHVIQSREQARAQLLSSLDREEFQGMRSYVLQEFPSPRAIENNSGIVPIKSVGPFDDILAFINKLKSEQGLSIDLVIETHPENAVFRVQPSAGGRERSTTSNSILKSIYRGLYSYSIVKPGYKSINETINLVDERPRKLDCQLHESQSDEGPFPCKRL
ncbi:MAG: hypothetical protein LPH21_17410 [Shewanella sp.]|nr:hypothetical protein [Shewanella sp.]